MCLGTSENLTWLRGVCTTRKNRPAPTAQDQGGWGYGVVVKGHTHLGDGYGASMTPDLDQLLLSKPIVRQQLHLKGSRLILTAKETSYVFKHTHIDGQENIFDGLAYFALELMDAGQPQGIL